MHKVYVKRQLYGLQIEENTDMFKRIDFRVKIKEEN